MNINKNILKLTLLLSLAGGWSCGEEGTTIPQEATPSIILSANVDRNLTTRIYQENGDVKEGNFFFTYPLLTQNGDEEISYFTSQVTFINGTAVVTDPEGSELIWNNVGYDSSSSETSFYLDNFPYGNPGEMVISLPSQNQYCAGVLDKVNGTNDLLWGSFKTSNRNDRHLPFQLHHCMCRICVIINVDNSQTQEPLDLSDAQITISDLILSPDEFDRTTGNLLFAGQPEYGELKLVEVAKDWEKITIPENSGIHSYQTKDFVLPPQELKKDLSRPQLTISIPQQNGEPKKYVAVIPNAMNVTVDGVAYPMTLSFMKELYLRLKVNINADDLTITFMPVTVEDWWQHDRVSLSGTQAGIYTPEDFYSLISEYNSGIEDQLQYLQYYGFKKEDGTWIFNIYKDDLTLDKERIAGKMNEENFSFDFHGNTVIIMSEGKAERTLTSRNNSNGVASLCNLLKTGNY